ncbi:MAG: TRAP transporter substrate-binding protein [Pseudomonadota bacterium]
MAEDRLSRRGFLKTTSGSLAFAGALAAPAVVRAQARVLRLSSWLPPVSFVVPFVLESWRESVAQVTDGRIEIEIVSPPMGPPPAHFDLVQSGQADLAYSLHGYSGDDAFVRAQVGQLSFLGDAYTASHSFAKVYQGMLAAQDEHEGVKLLSVFQHGPGVLMLKDKEIRGPEDFAGLRIRSSGGYIAKLLSALGAEPVAMSPLQVGENMRNGSIDGVAFPTEAAPVFQIYDTVSYISQLPGGYYNASWFMAMNQGVWDSLDERDRTAIEAMSQETLHVLAAKAFFVADAEALRTFKENGTPVVTASDEVLAFARQKAETFDAAWVERVTGLGYDGAEALRLMRRG